jgi:predicted outer membrane repeat protein
MDGAIQVWDPGHVSEFTVLNSYFENNTAVGADITNGVQYTSSAGAINTINLNKGTIKGTTFIGNKVIEPSISPVGGAIKATNTNIDIDDCTFENNYAAASGGAVYLTGNANVSNCNFISNVAVNNGGAIFAYLPQGTLNINDCNFTDNKAGNGGAAIYAHTGDVNIDGATFTGNNATNGAAIYVKPTATASVEDSTFDSNTANNGEAIYVEDSGSLTVDTSTFVDVIATITVNDTYTFGDLITIEGIFDWGVNNATIEMTYTINGAKQTVNATEGAYTITIDNQPDVGTYTIVISTFTDAEGNTYIVDSVQATFTIVKATPEIAIEIDPVTYGNYPEITINLTGIYSVGIPDASLVVTITDDDMNMYQYPVVTDENGTVFIAPILVLAPGTYNVTVNYGGGDNYETANKTESFTVIQTVITEMISVNDENVTIGEGIEITVTNITGLVEGDLIEVNLTVTNATGDDVFTEKYNITVGSAISVPALPAGSYSYAVTFTGDDKYTVGAASGISAIGFFNVDKINVTGNVSITGSEITYGENGTITADFVEFAGAKDASGNVTVTFINVPGEFRAAVVGGIAVVEIPGLAGNKTYEVKSVVYTGDDTYSGFTIEDSNIVIKVAQAPSKIEILGGLARTVYPGSITVVYRIVNATEVNICVRDGKDKVIFNQTLTGDEGRMIIDSFQITGLAVDTYSVSITNNETSNYLYYGVSDSFDVDRATPEISVGVQDVIYGNPAVATVTISENATGNVTVIINGKEYSAEIKQGTAIANIEAEYLIVGENKVNVFYDGDTNYTMNHNSTNFTVNQATIKIDSEVITQEPKYGSPVEVTVNVTGFVDGDNMELDIVLLRNNVLYFNGTFTFSGNDTYVFENLIAGEYNYTISYDGTGNYKPDSFTTGFTVSPVQLEVNATGNNNVTYADNYELSIATFGVDGYLDVKDVYVAIFDANTVEVYNKTIDINGRDKLSIPVNFKPGEYTILVSVPVQGINYYGDADTVALTVNKVNLTDKVTIKGSEIIYGDNGTITVDFPITYDAQVGGTVNVTLKEVNGIFTANVEGGLAIVEIPELPGNKTYEVASVKYSGDDYFEGFAFDDDNIVIKVAQAESSVTVLTFGNGTYPGNLNVIYMVQNATEVHIQVLKGLELVYNNTLTGDEGRMVLNGFNLTGLSVGSYTVIVSNNATGNYKFAMNYATFTVEKAAPEISIEVQNVIYDNPAVATVTISENATGNVTIIINGKEYSAEIKQGTATADIEAEFIILGENKVNVLYDGDANYTMNRNSTNFTAYGNVVTNDTFFTYFDQNGLLRDEVKFDELFFDGLFSDLPGIDRITAGYIDITGINDAVLYNIGLDVSYSSVSDIMFFADEAIGDLITAYDSVEISDVIINYTVANATEDAIAINVVGSDVAICDSEIYFESHAAYDYTEAMAINVDGDDVVIDNNSIVANLTAVRSYWSIYFQYGTMGIDKVHAIRITGSDIELTDNEIDAVINDGISTGEYDSPTIEAVLVIDSDNVLIYNNTITVTDPITPEGTPSYLYGMTLTAVDNVNVTGNTFVLDTDGGIDAAGAAYAIQLATCNIDIFDNDIISSSNGPNIGIYISGVATEMYGNPNPFYKKNFTVDIGFNNIDINGYSNSTNYGSLVSGIEACAGEITIALNEISVVNNAGFDENAGVYGISYAQTYYPYVPSFDIQQNNIEVNGNYAVAIINDAEALVTDNVLIADNLGDESVFANETLSTVERNYPAPLNITTSADNVTVDSPVVINVNTNTLFTGNVTLIFGSEEYNVSIVDGVGSYVLEDLAAADYDYTIEYIGFSYKYDDLFISDYADGNFTVLKYVTEIEVIPGEIIVDEDLAVELNIQKLNGTVSVIVDSTPIDDVSVVNGVGNFTIPKDIMTAGNHSIIVIVADNPKYENNQTTFTFTVEKAENYTFDVNLTFYEIKYGENATFNVTLPEDANGNLTVYVNDELVASVPVENGTASVTVPASAFETGFDTIAVSYGDDKYANTTVSTDIYVERIPGELYAGANNISIGENATVLVYIPTYTDGRVFVELLGIKYPVKIENNTGYVTIEGLDEGNYTALVSFEDDDIYLDNDTYVFFTVTKVVIPPEQAFNITTPENTTSQVISVELPEDATGFLLLEVNGTQTFVPLENGKANVTVPKLLEGAYNATITYTGDSKYAPITTTQEINVTSNVPDSALSIPESGKTDAPTTYSISLPSDATGFLTVDVDGTKHIASLVNGSANVTVPALSAGNHNVTVTYTGDTNYSPVVKSTTLNVTDPVFKITNNKNINVVYSAKATYKVLITRDGKAVGAGEKVTIKFNGKTYTVKTDAKGYATLKLKTKVKVKKYTITATYKGVTVKNTVKVKHVIKAKNRKVNKSKKAKKAAKAKAAKAAKSSKATAKKAKKRNYIKVKVSLKKVNGKYLKGKKITIKFKGKKYKIKTNKKGKAVWKLKKSKIKKLKVGKKYKFTATYGKDKVTKKLIIK